MHAKAHSIPCYVPMGSRWIALPSFKRMLIRSCGLMPVYGYARISILDQDFSIQHAALKGAGCEVIRSEKARDTCRDGAGARGSDLLSVTSRCFHLKSEQPVFIKKYLIDHSDMRVCLSIPLKTDPMKQPGADSEENTGCPLSHLAPLHSITTTRVIHKTLKSKMRFQFTT